MHLWDWRVSRFHRDFKYHGGPITTQFNLWYAYWLCLEYQSWQRIQNLPAVPRISIGPSKRLPHQLHSGNTSKKFKQWMTWLEWLKGYIFIAFQVFDGKTDNENMLRNFCGSVADSVMSKTNLVYVRFYAEKSGLGSQFESIFTAMRALEGPNDQCDPDPKVYSNT